jgi:3-mercaptopyruvate sulfurtransferase SseA
MPNRSWARLPAAAFIVFVLHAATALAGPLVSVEWLQDNLQRGDLVLIDASPGPAYAAGHIPGAVSHDIFSFGAGDAPPEEMEKRLQAWGLDPGK